MNALNWLRPSWLYENRPVLLGLISGVTVCVIFWAAVGWLVYEAIK